MEDKFFALFEYNNAMNIQIIDLIEANLPAISDKIFKVFSHMMNAHQIWNARINQLPEFQVWQLNNWSEIPQINAQNFENSLDILKRKDLDKVIRYKNTKGDIFSNKIEDILFHTINHSTYHRAQIATECRNIGIEPLITDYIMYKRHI